MFAEKGFGATTTREIAAHAQVNEALIFRHFPTKEELYWAVLEAKVRSEDFHLRLEELLAGAANVREALLAVAEWTLERRRRGSLDDAPLAVLRAGAARIVAAFFPAFHRRIL